MRRGGAGGEIPVRGSRTGRKAGLPEAVVSPATSRVTGAASPRPLRRRLPAPAVGRPPRSRAARLESLPPRPASPIPWGLATPLVACRPPRDRGAAPGPPPRRPAGGGVVCPREVGAPVPPRPFGESSGEALPVPRRVRACVSRAGTGSARTRVLRPVRRGVVVVAGPARRRARLACAGSVGGGAPGRRAGFRPRSSPDPRPALPAARRRVVVLVDRRRAPGGAIGAGRSPRPASFPARRRVRAPSAAVRGVRPSPPSPVGPWPAVAAPLPPRRSAPPSRAPRPAAPVPGCVPAEPVRPAAAVDGWTDGRTAVFAVSRGRVAGRRAPVRRRLRLLPRPPARPPAPVRGARPDPPSRARPRDGRPRRRAPAPVRLSRALGLPVPGSPRSLARAPPTWLILPVAYACLKD